MLLASRNKRKEAASALANERSWRGQAKEYGRFRGLERYRQPRLPIFLIMLSRGGLHDSVRNFQDV